MNDNKKVQKLIIWGGFNELLLVLYNFDVLFSIPAVFFFFNPIIDQKLFSANLRASFSQKRVGYFC